MAGGFDDVLLHVVSGKGGTGKSTVAASLALALASRGKTVLLCEVEGRQGIAQLFDVPPLPYEERLIARAEQDGHGDVYALAIDAEAALLEYLAMYYRLGRAGKALDRFGVIEFATTIAPGVRDILLTGKVYEAAYRNQRNRGARAYDAIVLDAPPTGRIAQFLNANNELAGLAKVGPVKSQADSVTALLRSRTAIHLVTLLEEMPVQETLDGIAELKADGLPVGSVVVNLVRPRDLSPSDLSELLEDRVDREALAGVLQKAGVDPSDQLLDMLLDEGREHAIRRAIEDTQRDLVNRAGVPVYELPRLPGGVGRGGLHELAAGLREQGMA